MKFLLGFGFLLLMLASCASQNNTVAKNPDGSLTLFDNGSNQVTIAANGNVGIDQKNPQDKLEVNGQIHAKSVKVDLKEWADFVFEEAYNLPQLREIEKYIKENGHLPEIPSAVEVAEKGIELGTMNRLLLQKIEELTLHLIAKEKEINSLSTNYHLLIQRLEVLEAAQSKND